MEKKVRLNLVMPPKTRELIDKLQARTGSATMSETIRRALVLLDVVSMEQEKGSALFFHDQSGKQTRLQLL
jgi:hypothetical protein